MYERNRCLIFVVIFFLLFIKHACEGRMREDVINEAYLYVNYTWAVSSDNVSKVV